MTLRQLLVILLARWWAIASVFGVTVAATVVVSLLLPKTYTASTSIVIEPRVTDVFGGANLGAQMLAQAFMATQIDVMQSQKVAERVVTNLGIPKSPQAQAQYLEETQGQGSIESYFAGQLTKHLEVTPSRESAVVALSFSGADPQFAAQVANAFAQAYIDTALELRTQPARQYTAWFDEQLKGLRAELERAQTRLSAFQQRNGIVGNDERLDVENARLAELSNQLVAAQAQSFDSSARAGEGSASVASVPEVAASPILAQLRTELARSEASLQQISRQYGTEHPTYQRQAAEIGALRERVNEELQHSSRSAGASARAGVRRVADLRAAVAAQKERVLELKKLRDEMAVLTREVENAQKIYELALQRYAQNSLESQTTQASASVLAPATAPAMPSSPRIKLNVILGAVLGAILGLGVALVLELADRRVRASDDIETSLNLPLLGVLGGAPRRTRRLASPRGPGPLLATQ